jgi:hypothetical protein
VKESVNRYGKFLLVRMSIISVPAIDIEKHLTLPSSNTRFRTSNS